MSELITRSGCFHSFLWASGGAYSDFYIHHIDECCWMKDAWPVEAQANGGRHYRGDCVDQNFDNYSVEYTFDDGAKLFYYGRSINGCFETYSSFAHGTKGTGVITLAAVTPSGCGLYKGQKITKENRLWASPRKEANPYQLEWNDLIAAIRDDKPYNEVERGAEGQPGLFDGPHGRPHRASHHVRTDDELPARVRPGRGQTGNGFPRPAARRTRRKISRPRAGNQERSGILIT